MSTPAQRKQEMQDARAGPGAASSTAQAEALLAAASHLDGSVPAGQGGAELERYNRANARLATLARAVTAYAIAATKAQQAMFQSLAAFLDYAPLELREQCYAPKEALEQGRQALALWDALRWGKEEGRG